MISVEEPRCAGALDPFSRARYVNVFRLRASSISLFASLFSRRVHTAQANHLRRVILNDCDRRQIDLINLASPSTTRRPLSLSPSLPQSIPTFCLFRRTRPIPQSLTRCVVDSMTAAVNEDNSSCSGRTLRNVMNSFIATDTLARNANITAELN